LPRFLPAVSSASARETRLCGPTLGEGNKLDTQLHREKYLNEQAVFQLNLLQEGETITVDFVAVYNDGHGCAP
jgi:hypothetical protein